jgi:hypothetical protein
MDRFYGLREKDEVKDTDTMEEKDRHAFYGRSKWEAKEVKINRMVKLTESFFDSTHDGKCIMLLLLLLVDLEKERKWHISKMVRRCLNIAWNRARYERNQTCAYKLEKLNKSAGQLCCIFNCPLPRGNLLLDRRYLGFCDVHCQEGLQFSLRHGESDSQTFEVWQLCTEYNCTNKQEYKATPVNSFTTVEGFTARLMHFLLPEDDELHEKYDHCKASIPALKWLLPWFNTKNLPKDRRNLMKRIRKLDYDMYENIKSRSR